MEYVKTFLVLAVFLFLAFGTIVSNIRHYKENEGERKRKRAKKKAKREERKRRIGRLFGKKYATTNQTALEADEYETNSSESYEDDDEYLDYVDEDEYLDYVDEDEDLDYVDEDEDLDYVEQEEDQV